MLGTVTELEVSLIPICVLLPIKAMLLEDSVSNFSLNTTLCQCRLYSCKVSCINALKSLLPVFMSCDSFTLSFASGKNMSLPKLAFFQKFSQRKKYCFVATLVELACEYIIILYIYISVGSKCGNIGPEKKAYQHNIMLQMTHWTVLADNQSIYRIQSKGWLLDNNNCLIWLKFGQTIFYVHRPVSEPEFRPEKILCTSHMRRYRNLSGPRTAPSL